MKQRTLVNGWLFIPSTMVFCALTWGTASDIPAILLKSMDVPNIFVGFASILGLPIALRFLFGPFVDARGTKRKWTLSMQSVISGTMLLLASLCGLSLLMGWSGQIWFLGLLMVLFAVLAFVSAFNDLSWGGFFLTAVDEREKGLFVGVNAAFIRVANIFSMGFMVVIAGKIEAQTGQTMAGWAVCFGVFGIIQLTLMIYHRLIYPHPILDRPLQESDRLPFLQVFALFLKEPRAWAMLAFVFLYRIDQGLLQFMKVPFLMDSPEAGGLAVPLENIGLLNGVYGTIAMITGGVIGGICIRQLGLRKVIWPFAFMITLPNLGFVWLALDPVYETLNVLGADINKWAFIVTVIEAFGYGLGFSSFAFFQCEAARGPHRATFFALLAGIMAVSYILTGMLSGVVQSAVGYDWLFIISMIASIPGIAIIAWLPLKYLEEKGKEEDRTRHMDPDETSTGASL
jgi:PAT family beta-lactamase induction signal transducer AmpG